MSIRKSIIIQVFFVMTLVVARADVSDTAPPGSCSGRYVGMQNMSGTNQTIWVYGTMGAGWTSHTVAPGHYLSVTEWDFQNNGISCPALLGPYRFGIGSCPGYISDIPYPWGGGQLLYPVNGQCDWTTNTTVTNYYCADITVKNADLFVRTYAGCKDGNPIEVFSIQVGGSYVWHHCETSPWAATVIRIGAGTDAADLTLFPTMTTNTTPSGAGSGTNILNTASPPGQIYNLPATNINWAAGTNDQQMGFAALLDAATRTIQALGALTNLHGGGGGALVVSNITGAGTTIVSNSTYVTITNNNTATVSNVFEVGSVYSTNLSGVYTNLLSGTATNWGGASNAAISALAGAFSDAQSLEDAVGDAPTMGSGDSSPFSFSFCGKTLCLDPKNLSWGGEALVPGFAALPDIIKTFITFLVTLAFCFWGGRQYADAVKLYSSAQTGGVPDLEAELAGFGGNVAGVVVGLLIPIVFVAGWVVLFRFIFGKLLTTLTGLHSMDPFGSFPGGALYLIDMFIPVSLILSLAWAQLGLYFGLNKLVLIAASASRFLFGK